MTRFSSKKIQRGNLRIISVAWQNSSGVSFAARGSEGYINFLSGTEIPREFLSFGFQMVTLRQNRSLERPTNTF